jgi:hypothetical protein
MAAKSKVQRWSSGAGWGCRGWTQGAEVGTWPGESEREREREPRAWLQVRLRAPSVGVG